jgi:hypothetical protein
MTHGATARIGAALIALAGWAGLGLQLDLLVDGFVARGEAPSAAVWRFFAYFTILTNIVAAVVMTSVAFGVPALSGHSLVTGATMNIAVVGLVYHFVLASLWDPQGAQRIVDILLHYVTPVGVLLFWIALEPKGGVTWRDGLIWLVYPGVYLIYALWRGAADGFYPYPFIDVTTIGLEQTLLNAMGLLIGFTMLGQLFVFLDGALGAAAMRRALR